ncbi:MAG TPA: hypothetical protein VGR95_15205 [Thermoanaerobaculia bacterium]|nr:hypothetical protein [Thermoanaerobaculia bacterium]
MGNTCFVIAPIGEEGSAVRQRSDQLLRYVISPVVVALGYGEPIRADRLPSPGIITSQVIKHIVDDSIVIADLTGANPNVYYELAIRHMIRKPLVQIIEKGERIPFDVAAARTIILDHTNLDSVEAAKKELSQQIVAATTDPDSVDNPISMSIDLGALRVSADPLRQSVVTLTSEVAAIREEIQRIRKDQKPILDMGLWDLLMQRMDEFEFSLGDHTTAEMYASDVVEELRQLTGRLSDIENMLRR